MTQILNAVDAEQQEKLKNCKKSLKNIKVKRGFDACSTRGTGSIWLSSLEVQQLISDGLNIPLSEVYGVATFYSQFTLTPREI